MRLISLSANQPTFRPVHFHNRTGLNFVVATQTLMNVPGDKRTFNGVGKSLLVALINFCLGSSKKDEFERHLPNWSFTLKFEIRGIEYAATRSTGKQNVIDLDSKEYRIKDFNNLLESLTFTIPEGVSQLSFRSLLPFFLRPRRGSYTKFDNPNTLQNDFQILICNAFLLGLDVFLVEEKFRLRKEKERIKNLLNELRNDDLLKNFFVGSRDVSLAALELDDDIQKLVLDLENFQVAEDYYDIKKAADKIKKALEEVENRTVLLKTQISNIDESRKIAPDIRSASIKRIYEEASVVISEHAMKQLEELEKFYEHLTVNREKRLLDQKNELSREIKHLETESERLKIEFDSHLKYLNTHRALDVFVKLTNKLSDLKAEKEKLERYDELMKEYQTSKTAIEKDFIEATEKAYRYISDAEGLIRSIREFFRDLTKRFYPDSSAGITVYNNDGDNQIRFDIDAKIQADASDGINNVKIFCYDMTLLLKGSGHNINFLFHDSRLLDGIDPRQVSEIFRVLNNYITSNGKQYILTINQNHLDEVKPHLSNEEYQRLILDNICHELKDDTVENKLLGIQVDMEYD